MKRNLLLGAAALLGLLSSSTAAVYTVTNTNDSGAGSLRQAVADANGNAGSDTVDFSLGIGSHTITLTSGQIEISDALTLQKPFIGSGNVTVSGNGASRVFDITSSGSGSVTLRQFTVQDGSAAFGSGGGLRIEGSNVSVILENMSITNNEAVGPGGGIAFDSEGGSVVLERCKITNNDSESIGGGLCLSNGDSVRLEASEIANNTSSGGGGIYSGSFGGSLEINSSTISGNVATASGGGAFLGGGSFEPTFTITNTTISGNSTDYSSGGLYLGNGSGTLTNCTITNNTADADGNSIGWVGGLLHSGTETITLTNCLVAGNEGNGSGDIDGDVLASGGHNFIGSGSSLTNFSDGVNGDQIGNFITALDPLLGPLGDHGGPTDTHVLLTGSPAIDAGDSAAITEPPFDGPTFEDQIGNNRIVDTAVDIGATEFQDIVVVTSTADSGNGSLRSALADATATGGKTILFDEVVFGSLQTITLTGGEIEINNSVSVSGPEAGVVISAGNSSRVFRIIGSGTGVVEFKNLRLVDGSSTANGGAARIGGVGTEVIMRQCGVSNSHADESGGGLYVNQATATLFGCTVSRNDADGNGGGLHCSGNGNLNVLQTTVSGNSTLQRGGGLYATNCTAVFLNSTITNNTADAGASNLSNGGGIRRGTDAEVRVGNTIIAGNVDASSAGSVHPDVSGEFVSLGHNLIGIDDGLDASGTPFTNGVNGDQVGSGGSPISPGLSALSLPAGTNTRVHLLQSGSPASDSGDDSLLEDTVWPSSPLRDQRGQFRVVNGTVDIGAIEFPNETLVSILAVDDVLNDFTEDSGKIRISRSFDVGDLDVTLEIPAGSSAQASDVVDGMSTFVVTIPDGKPFTTVSFTPVKDGMVEGDETLTLKLVNTARYSIDPTLGDQADLTIRDGDFLVSNGNDAGTGSLRSAVEGANAAEGGFIVIPEGTGPIELLTSQLVVNAEMTIEGNGETIDAGGNTRLFRIDTGGVGCVRLKDLILTGGASSFEGGAVKVWPTSCLVITRCALTENTAQKTGGGLYFEDADVTIRNSSIDSNTVTESEGGGIQGINGSLEIVSSTVAKNSAPFHGGGVALDNTEAALTNVTITANTCDNDDDGLGDGGGLWSKIGGREARPKS